MNTNTLYRFIVWRIQHFIKDECYCSPHHYLQLLRRATSKDKTDFDALKTLYKMNISREVLRRVCATNSLALFRKEIPSWLVQCKPKFVKYKSGKTFTRRSFWHIAFLDEDDFTQHVNEVLSMKFDDNSDEVKHFKRCVVYATATLLKDKMKHCKDDTSKEELEKALKQHYEAHPDLKPPEGQTRKRAFSKRIRKASAMPKEGVETHCEDSTLAVFDSINQFCNTFTQKTVHECQLELSDEELDDIIC